MIIAPQWVRNLFLHPLLSQLIDQLRSLGSVLIIFAENFLRLLTLPQVRRLRSLLFVSPCGLVWVITIFFILKLDVLSSSQKVIPLTRCLRSLIHFWACNRRGYIRSITPWRQSITPLNECLFWCTLDLADHRTFRFFKVWLTIAARRVCNLRWSGTRRLICATLGYHYDVLRWFLRLIALIVNILTHVY